MAFFKKKEQKNDDSLPVLVAVIQNTVSSEIYQDILKENGIPCVCAQEGAGGYIKLITGGLLVADSIYVNAKDYERAKELYEVYLKTEVTLNDEEVD